MLRIIAAIALVTALSASASAASAIAAGPVNLRAGPGTGYGILAVVRAGEVLAIGACNGNWCAASRITGSPLDGWIYRTYLTFLPDGGHPYRRACNPDPNTAFHMRFGLYYTPLAEYCRSMTRRD